MWRAQPPIVLQAAGVAVGAAIGFQLADPSAPLSVALLGLCLARGGAAGRVGAALAAGLVAAAVAIGASAIGPDGLDADRPVILSGRRVGEWRQEDDGWSTTIRVASWRQGHRVAAGERRLGLSVYGTFSPPAGRSLRARGYLRRAPGLANSPPSPPGPLRLVVKSGRFVEARWPATMWSLERVVRSARERLLGRLGGKELSTPGRRFVRALVLGERDAIPRGWQRGLRRCGLSHLLAVSGLHVALVAGMLWISCRWLGRGARSAVIAAGIGLYVLLAGARPALVRASVMAWAALATWSLSRPPNAAAALGAAILLMVLVEPTLIVDLGFQLTVSATAGLIAVAPRLEERWAVVPGVLRRPLAATAAAQICTWTWVLAQFHLLTPWAPLANLLAVPWMSAVLALALCWAAVAALHPRLGEPLMAALDVVAAPIAWPAELPGRWLLNLPLSISPAGALLLSACSIGALLWLRPLALGALVVAGALALKLAGEPPSVPELVMVDVGQGDSLLLRSGGVSVLVDGGGWRYGEIGGRVLLPVLAGLQVRRLDVVVMSHPDRDHCKGLTEIAAYLPIAEVWMAPGWKGAGCAVELMTLPGPRLRPLWGGSRLEAGEWRLRALHPAAGQRGPSNDRSLVLLAEARGSRVLLTGDLEALGERKLVRRWQAELQRIDVLKVAHHGSRGSSSKRLLEAIRPRLALISAGAHNLYGHPSTETLRRLEAVGSRIVRSDRHGMTRLRMLGDGRIEVDFPGQPRP